MYIRKINKIPLFIGRYFNNGKISIDDINEFEKIIINSEYFFYDKNKYATKLKSKPKLLDFYIEHSKLDNKYYCKYEDELDIPKSISNEIYKFEIVGDDIIAATIDFNEDENLLIINIEEI